MDDLILGVGIALRELMRADCTEASREVFTQR